MPDQEVDFRCLRCGHGWEGTYDPKEPEERACPQCRSNSVRPLPRKPAPRPAGVAAKATKTAKAAKAG